MAWHGMVRGEKYNGERGFDDIMKWVAEQYQLEEEGMWYGGMVNPPPKSTKQLIVHSTHTLLYPSFKTFLVYTCFQFQDPGEDEL
jgi:hypothetical protein